MESSECGELAFESECFYIRSVNVKRIVALLLPETLAMLGVVINNDSIALDPEFAVSR
jgi:hypothetical protein